MSSIVSNVRGVSTLESKSHLSGACSPRRFSAPTGSRPIMGGGGGGPVEESSALVAIKLLSRAHRVCPAGTTAISTSGQDIHTGPIQSPRRAFVSSFFALRSSCVLGVYFVLTLLRLCVSSLLAIPRASFLIRSGCSRTHAGAPLARDEICQTATR